MYAAIYRFKTDHRAHHVVRHGHDELGDIMRNIPGLVSHYVVDIGNDQAVIFAVYHTEAQVQQFHTAALGWITNSVAPQWGAPYDQAPLDFSFGHVQARNTQDERHLDVAKKV